PAIAARNETAPPAAQQEEPSKPAEADTIKTPTDVWNQIVSAQKSEPPAPGLGPNEAPTSASSASAATPAPENSDQSSTNESNQSAGQSKKKSFTSNRTPTYRTSRPERALPDEDLGQGPNYQTHRHVARVVGKT